jgi:hypothetical protein
MRGATSGGPVNRLRPPRPLQTRRNRSRIASNRLARGSTSADFAVLVRRGVSDERDYERKEEEEAKVVGIN